MLSVGETGSLAETWQYDFVVLDARSLMRVKNPPIDDLRRDRVGVLDNFGSRYCFAASQLQVAVVVLNSIFKTFKSRIKQKEFSLCWIDVRVGSDSVLRTGIVMSCPL